MQVESLEELAFRLNDQIMNYLLKDNLERPKLILEILEDAKVYIEPITPCKRCAGSGDEPDKQERDICDACDGSGMRTQWGDEVWIPEPLDLVNAFSCLLDLIDEVPEAKKLLEKEENLIIASCRGTLKKSGIGVI